MAHIGMLSAPCVLLAACCACVDAGWADCTCRAGGANYELGETVCIATPNGFRLAVCGMVLNNTSWKVSSEACVAADAIKRLPMTGSFKAASHGSWPGTVAACGVSATE